MLNKKTISLMQISIMIVATFAFAFILNSAFVNATDNGDGRCIGTCLDQTAAQISELSEGLECSPSEFCPSDKSFCCIDTGKEAPITQEREEPLEVEDWMIGEEIWPKGKSNEDSKSPLPANKYTDNLEKRLGQAATNRISNALFDKAKDYVKDLDSKDLAEKESSLGDKLGTFAKDIFGGYFKGFTGPLYKKGEAKDIEATGELTNSLYKWSKKKLGGDEAIQKIVEKKGEDAAAKAIHEKGMEQLSKRTVSNVATYLNSFAWAMTGAKIYLQAIQLFGSGERNVRTIQKSQLASVPLGTAAGIMAVSAGIPGPGWIAAGVTATVMGFWTAFTHQDYSREVFVYDVQGWQPPIGGEHCQECNDLRYGCSEYQCHTFGTACELINIGTEDERCVWVNKNDMNPPEITTLDILDEDYSYSPSKEIKYPQRGANLKYKGGCIEPFTSVKFGVKTNEPSQCKIDIKRNQFENMSSYMAEGTSFLENHTIEIPASAIPSASALEGVGWSIDAGKEYSFYISCMDSNGNVAPYHFVMNFCVDDGPDTSPPVITGTNYLDGEYIKTGKSSIPDFEVYTNEPADCKWDYKDLDYESMNYEFLDCSKEIGNYLFEDTFTYGCKGVLNGLKDNEKNTFYIRCKDKPWLSEENEKEVRIANKESYELNLFGTKGLGIKSIKVNGQEDGTKIVDSTDNIKVLLSVETIEGAEEGNAKCTYKKRGDSLFFDFDSNLEGYNYLNEHSLRLEEGAYIYDIRCFDRAGNTADGNISFTIDTDLEEPIIARAYYEDNHIVLVTTENATCTYNTNSCDQSYVDSIEITTSDNVEHYLAWDTEQDLFIKCQDIYGNRPDPGICNIVVRGHELYSISDLE
jgi:hypothetical protein